MNDLVIVLLVILAVVLLVRGPKTLPRLGEAFGRFVREARHQANRPSDPDDGAANRPPDADRRP